MAKKMLNVTNPSTLERITQVPQDDQQSALTKLDKCFKQYRDIDSWLVLHERIEILERLIDIMKDREDMLGMQIAQEGGKPLKDARVEAARAIQGVKFAIETITEHRGTVVPLAAQASSAGLSGVAQKFPRGVVLAFSAFNHPLNLIVHQIVTAFAAGCPCVVKPASDTPLSCLALVDAMHEAGVPDSYLQAVIPENLDIAGELVASNKIAFFTFIGSGKVGWMLRKKLADGVRCALEHGGVAPCFVTANANIHKAAQALTKGGFYHAGQVCVSTQKIFVHKTKRDEFVSTLKKHVEKLVTGDATHADTDVGPLIRTQETDRVEEWVKEAVSGGAECVVGGKKIADNYYAPTILLNPSKTSKISNEEVFGPVVCVYTYDSLEDEIKKINDSPYAFQAAIFSDSLDEINVFYNNIHALTAIVNNHTAFRDDIMPFGGLKTSGLGVGGIPHTIEDMQYEKLLVRPL